MKIEYQLLHHVINSNYLVLIPNFYYIPNGFESDLFGVTERKYTVEYEIKRTKADYHNDFNKGMKHAWIEQGNRTNRFYFVIEQSIDVEVPEYAGLIKFEERNYGRLRFRYHKRAPLLHKKEAPQKLLLRCLKNLSWRNYLNTRK